MVLPNLNYNVPRDGTQDVPQDVPLDGTQETLNLQILTLIRRDNKISTEKMAMELGVSVRTVKRRIKEMNNVSYVGSGFSGHWEIRDE